MSEFNSHMEQLDCSPVATLFREKGEFRILKKRDYFLRQDEASRFIALLQSGAFRYTCIDDDGSEHIVGYSFETDFICDFASLIHDAQATVNIQAITDSEIYLLPYATLTAFWEMDMEKQRLGRKIVEELFSEIYQRLLGFYRDTPEQRYLKLMERCPNLKEKIPLKEIASFLNVTPETVSHIRRKLRHP